jgi:molecular chaperone GrpE
MKKRKTEKEMSDPEVQPQDGENQPNLDADVQEEELSPEQQVDQLKQQLQRVAADYQNFQKRSVKQIAQAGQFAQQSMAKDILAVLDSFEHTFAAANENQEAADLIKGVRIIYDQLLNILSGHSIAPIEVKPGEPFDPILHEAMLRQTSDEFEENAVIAEFTRGYTINEITLRPAKVSVARAATDEQSPDQEENNADL